MYMGIWRANMFAPSTGWYLPCPVAHSTQDLLTQATVKALHVAKTSGDQSLVDLCQSKGDELAKSEDITKTVLAVERQNGPDLPAACAAIQKACVVSFQTWSMRSSDFMLGLLVGKTVKKRLTIHTVLVGRDLAKMLQDPKLEFLHTHHAVSVHGLILPDTSADGQDMGTKMLRCLSETYPDASLCIFVPRLSIQGNTHNTYICTIYSAYMLCEPIYLSMVHM